jgi:uncharacterized cupin superfamily protein
MHEANVFHIATETDSEDPPGYKAGAVKLAPIIGGREIGGSIYDLPPGQSICPYHYEFGAEEWLIVLQGRPLLRRAEGDRETEEELAPGDTVCFPRGPSGAHKVTNATAGSVRVLMLSTMPEVDISYYPDSDKYGVWPGGDIEGFLARRENGVDYYDGER